MQRQVERLEHKSGKQSTSKHQHSSNRSHSDHSQSTMPDAEYPDCYREPLSAYTIRLLRLLPGQDEHGPIHCSLFHYSLPESTGSPTDSYEALSYVWGGSSKHRSIFIRQPTSSNDHELPVTDNLYDALLQLRAQCSDRLIWIDAVCINQEDVREKEQQIQFMARIYAQAKQVIVWLGNATEDGDRALQEIHVAGTKTMDSSGYLMDETVEGAMHALLNRPWFRRIWVRKTHPSLSV